MNPTWTLDELGDALQPGNGVWIRRNHDSIEIIGRGWVIKLTNYGWEASPDGEGGET